MRLWVRLIIIIWCDGVKIPLTVNENKSYVLVETAKFESVRKSAVNIRGEIPELLITMLRWA